MKQLSLEFPEDVHLVGLSGGKDSTALALALKERYPRVDFQYICTPTGDELPEMVAHWERLEAMLGKPLIRITNGTLKSWIGSYKALPNWRQRWCTRVLKIQPTIAYVQRLQLQNRRVILYVGLRADETAREGIISNDVDSRFPFQEWGWGLKEVLAYLKRRGVTVPERTDCARCPFQRLYEWEDLLVKHPEIYADAEADEEFTGHTYRSPQRDTRPAALRELRQSFAMLPAKRPKYHDEEDEAQKCRVCSL